MEHDSASPRARSEPHIDWALWDDRCLKTHFVKAFGALEALELMPLNLQCYRDVVKNLAVGALMFYVAETRFVERF